jgi:CRP-like cAMP-binding protein
MLLLAVTGEVRVTPPRGRPNRDSIIIRSSQLILISSLVSSAIWLRFCSNPHHEDKEERYLQRTGLPRLRGGCKKDCGISARRGHVHPGDPCEHVLYIQKGNVKLSVLSKAGREAVVAMLGTGEFFGEGCLAGQPVRMGSAIASADSTILLVNKEQMVRLIHKQHALSDRFIAHMLARNIRIEEDLIDQLFNSTEKRLARTAPVAGAIRQAR